MPLFPSAPKHPYPITQHSETRVNDYFWLHNGEVMKYPLPCHRNQNALQMICLQGA